MLKLAVGFGVIGAVVGVIALFSVFPILLLIPGALVVGAVAYAIGSSIMDDEDDGYYY